MFFWACRCLELVFLHLLFAGFELRWCILVGIGLISSKEQVRPKITELPTFLVKG